MDPRSESELEVVSHLLTLCTREPVVDAELHYRNGHGNAGYLGRERAKKSLQSGAEYETKQCLLHVPLAIGC